MKMKMPKVAKMPHPHKARKNKPKFETAAKPAKDIVKSYKPKKKY